MIQGARDVATINNIRRRVGVRDTRHDGRTFGSETVSSNTMTRREMLMSSGSLAAASVAMAVGLPVGTAVAADAAKPNLVFILVDDLGWKDVGFHGSDIKTPNIDQLAETGARLEQYYVQPMCTPTRAALMTGRYPLRYGLQTAVIPSGGQYGLATDEWLLPQALKQAGYETALVGKWHLGHADRKYWPGERGFEYSYGPLIGEIDHFKHESHGVTDWYRNGELVEEPGYDTTLFGNDAVRLIEEHDAGNPLFLYLAFTAPHTPYQAPDTYLDMYKDIADPARRAYAAQITAMDEQVGRVVHALDQRGMRDNTLIIFASDNGGTRSRMFAGEAAVAGELPPNNGPYRDGKGSVYEGGTRVVALANWPGRIKPGVVDEMVPRRRHVSDFCGTGGGGARQEQAIGWCGCLVDHQSGRRFAAHGNRLQHRALPRSCQERRHEAGVADAPAGDGRALRSIEGPGRDDKSRRAEWRHDPGTAGTDR